MYICVYGIKVYTDVGIAVLGPGVDTLSWGYLEFRVSRGGVVGFLAGARM